MNSPDRSGITVSARSYTTFWDTIAGEKRSDYAGFVCKF